MLVPLEALLLREGDNLALRRGTFIAPVRGSLHPSRLGCLFSRISIYIPQTYTVRRLACPHQSALTSVETSCSLDPALDLSYHRVPPW